LATSITDYGNVTALTVQEELAGEEAEIFTGRAADCLNRGKFNFVVDCASLDGFDSAGLEALLDLQNRCEDQLGAVKLCSLNETCAKVLEITRLARRFEIFGELESAVKSFG